MCGIVGLLELQGTGRADSLSADVDRMAHRLSHRGPDDHGVWCDQPHGIALGHRRLSIVDLSAAGHQPMFSADDRYAIVYNGEIYNYQELRAELERAERIEWKGHSDTEILLAAISRWGVTTTLERATGMFVIALWDKHTNTLTLARDRLGEKPLYYGQIGGRFAFASELKALMGLPGFQFEVDREALAQLLTYSYVPSPRSILSGVRKLPAGTSLTVDVTGNIRGPDPYWSPREFALRGMQSPSSSSDEQAMRQLDELLSTAVRQQMVADVPLGAFLSGGIDSSTVVALMQKQSARAVRTFTIGFTQAGYNEAEHARAVARHLGTDHTELVLKPEDALELLPRMPELYDEPFADASQLPTFLVAQLARQHVTVSLSGDGGDELFGGYNRHMWGPALWRRFQGKPLALRRAVAATLRSVPTGWGSSMFKLASGLLPSRLRYSQVDEKLQKITDAMTASSPAQLFDALVTKWPRVQELVISTPSSGAAAEPWLDSANLEQSMMYRDLTTYLPDDVLVKVDRAAMGVSLETRVPMLDHHVVEFALQLPVAMKIRDGQGKWLLRQVLYQYVPRNLIERPKMGFSVPVGDWLRGPLREWAEALLDATRLEKEGYFRAQPIRRAWQEHLTGRRDHSERLWIILMFQAWLGHWNPRG
jgi:asparagine synthase (glutamine-hydrolysing)